MAVGAVDRLISRSVLFLSTSSRTDILMQALMMSLFSYQFEILMAYKNNQKVKKN